MSILRSRIADRMKTGAGENSGRNDEPLLSSWQIHKARMVAICLKGLQGGQTRGHPGVVINCSSVLECRAAVACSEVPTFRFESALGPAAQEMAEHGMSVHCL